MKNLFIKNTELPFFELRLTEDNPEPYNLHSHSTLSIGAMTSGKTTMTSKSEQKELKAGELVIINPKRAHSCNPGEGNVRSYLMIYLDERWCRELQGEIFGESKEFRSLKTEIIREPELFNRFVNVCEKLIASDDNMEQEQEIISLMSEFFIKYCDDNESSKETNHIIEDIKKHLIDNLQRNVSLEELSGKFRMNRYHLLRYFKAETGMTPHSFLINVRVERAKELLNSGKTLATTAHETGFTDQSHMHKNFKKYISATPKDYQPKR